MGKQGVHPIGQSRTMNYDNYDCRIRVAPPKAAKAVRRKTAPKVRRPSRALTRTIGALAVAICSLATVASGQIVFQPLNETASKDAKVYNHVSSMPFNSDLSATYLTPDPAQPHFASLIRFDISSVGGFSHQITNAYLTLYATGATGSVPTTAAGGPGSPTTGGFVSVSPMLDSWKETFSEPVSGPLATYDAVFGIPANGSNPEVPPTLHFGTAVATTAIGEGAGYYTWDITNLVKSWADGTTPNYGVIIQAATIGTDVQFADTDSPSTGFGPSLTVVPEPGSAVLALVGATACFVRRRRAGTH